MNAALPYCSAANGSGWKYPLRAIDCSRYNGAVAVEVIIGDADTDFRYALDVDASSDEGKTWTHYSGVIGSTNADNDKVVTIPAAGLCRLVLKVEDVQGFARVYGALTVNVRR